MYFLKFCPAGKRIGKCLADPKHVHPAWQDKQFEICLSANSCIFALFQFRKLFLDLPKQYETASAIVMNSVPRFDVAGADEKKCAKGRCPRFRDHTATAAFRRSRYFRDIPIGGKYRLGNYPNPHGPSANRRVRVVNAYRGMTAFAPPRARCSPGCSRS